MRALASLLFLPAVALAGDPVAYTVVDGAEIPAPLAGVAGDPSKGAGVFAAAGCAGCHAVAGAEDGPAIGPSLAGVGARLAPGAIRLWIVDPTILAPETEMPSYHRVGLFGEVADDLVGRTRLTAADVEALVAWLSGAGGAQARDDEGAATDNAAPAE